MAAGFLADAVRPWRIESRSHRLKEDHSGLSDASPPPGLFGRVPRAIVNEAGRLFSSCFFFGRSQILDFDLADLNARLNVGVVRDVAQDLLGVRLE